MADIKTNSALRQSQFIKLDHLSPFRKVREGLAGVISMHVRMLTNENLLLHFETVATPCKTNTGAVLGLLTMTSQGHQNLSGQASYFCTLLPTCALHWQEDVL